MSMQGDQSRCIRYTLEHEDAPPPESDTPAEPVVITWSLGDRASKRVMYKIAIELLAYFDAQGARAPELDPVRRFVGAGTIVFSCIGVQSPIW
jgi:hypothetical protein